MKKKVKSTSNTTVREYTMNAPEYQLQNKVRVVTAASLFDGHDAAINIMRRLFKMLVQRSSTLDTIALYRNRASSHQKMHTLSH